MFTVKANIRAQEEREKKRNEKNEEKEFVGPVRRKRTFEFNEPGKYISLADDLRKQARKEELKRRIESASQRTGIKDAAKLASLSIAPIPTTRGLAAISRSNQDALSLSQEEEKVPSVEWWDMLLLKGRPLEEVVQNLKTIEPQQLFDGITHLVEHPVLKSPPIDMSKAPPPPIYLTKKEKKRWARSQKREAYRLKQEQIKLGLEAPPEPRLTKSNMMRALGQEAILEPSKSEAKVKEQISQRQKAHLEHNESKKLTGELRKEKKLKKFQEDLTLTGIHVSVYRILNLGSQAHKYKVSVNARQLTMTGIILLYKDINVVVVEGGPKQQKKFKRLMLDRIKWTEFDDSVSHTEDASPSRNHPVEANGRYQKQENKCLLVWEGQVKERAFKDMKTKQLTSEIAAREFFKAHGCEHYWDLAFKMSILDSIRTI